MYDQKVRLTMHTDTQSLCGLYISSSRSTRRRLQIDLSPRCKPYKNRHITDIAWIARGDNLPDDLTKTDKRNGMLAKIVKTSYFRPNKPLDFLRCQHCIHLWFIWIAVLRKGKRSNVMITDFSILRETTDFSLIVELNSLDQHLVRIWSVLQIQGANLYLLV